MKNLYLKITPKFVIAKFVIVLSLLTSCSSSKSSDTKSITGTASVLMGASTGITTTSLNQTLSIPSDGNWNLSPSRAKITLTRIDFVKSSSESVSATLNNCEVTYDRSIASGESLLDCAFTLTSDSYAGDYIGIYIYYQRTVQVQINDTTNNFYTDSDSATLLATTAPAGGADYVAYTVGGGTASQDPAAQVYLKTPYTIVEGQSPSIQIVTDMIHTIMAQVSSSTPSFSPNAGQSPVQLFAAPSGVTATSEFYSTSTTLEGVHLGGTGETYFRIFYIDNAPMSVMTSGYINGCASGTSISQAYAMNPATAPAQDSSGSKAGGYLGLNTGFLYWALPQNWQWSSYAGLYKLERKSSVGDTAQLHCAASSTATAPTSGDTYSSGGPTFTPTASMTLRLLAK